MGMIANYAAVTEADYRALKLIGNDNFADDCEELFEEAQDLLDLYKTLETFTLEQGAEAGLHVMVSIW